MNYRNLSQFFLHLSCVVCMFPMAQISSAQDQAVVPAVDLLSVDGAGKIQIIDQPKERITALCFLGTECPLAKLYAGRLQKLSVEFDDVRFIGINSNVQDSIGDIEGYIRDSRIEFEFAKDYDNRFADQLRVTRTPEIVVFDNNRKIIYRGRVDDQYLPGVSRSSATRDDLRIAIEESLAGQKVSVPETEPAGCLLGRTRESKANATVTFANQVSRVLQRNCVECHREGEIGPFSLETYEEAIGWADMMLEVIEEQRMPPWHADSDVGQFSNARVLSEDNKDILKQWVEQGTPMGDVAELPEPVQFVSGWRLPKAPDRVIQMSSEAFSIPADETVEYQYFVVDPKFTQDRWVTAAEVIPGNASVVHHSIVFIRPPDGSRVQGVGWLAAYVPGQTPLTHDPRRARFIPKGSLLVFQMHYTPNGKPQTDNSKIGLVFADQSEIDEELITVMAIDQDFEIQPFDESHEVEIRQKRLPRSGKLLSVSPHMHYRGKSFVATTVSQDRQTTSLVSVPAYDFNWQHRYELAEPVPLESIQHLEAVVEFDNSEQNPFNPDASQLVSWGDQTWEEMAVAFFDISVPVTEDSQTENQDRKKKEVEKLTESQEKQVAEITLNFFKRFDKNDDGVVLRSELPRATRTWGFNAYDTDGDGKLTRDEVRYQAESRVR